MEVILTAMNHFFNKYKVLQMSFLNRNHPNHQCEIISQYIKAGGEEVVMSIQVKVVVTNQYNTVKNLLIRYSFKVVWNISICPR